MAGLKQGIALLNHYVRDNMNNGECATSECPFYFRSSNRADLPRVHQSDDMKVREIDFSETPPS